MSTALARLKKAANLKSTKRTIVLSDGGEFEFWCKPLTMAERERAQKNAKTDDINQVALQMLVEKAQDANGSRMFGPGDVAVLKHEVRDDDLQKLMLAILNEGEEDEEEELDLKSTRK